MRGRSAYILALALMSTNTLQTPASRELLVYRLRDQLNDPGLAEQHPDPFRQSYTLVVACLRQPHGIRWLVEEVELLEGLSESVRSLRRLCDEWEAAETFRADDWELRDVLSGLRTPHLVQLFQRAAGFPHSPPPWCRDAWDMFVYLEGMNARGDLPPSMMFLALLEQEVDPPVAGRIRRRNQRRAASLGLTAELEHWRYTRDADVGARRTDTTYLIMVAEPDGTPTGSATDRYTVSALRQWHGSDSWRSAPLGVTRWVSRDDLASLFGQTIEQSADLWADWIGRVKIEFVLPAELLGADVAWWRTDSPTGPIALSYPVVVRSLDRLRKVQWHRGWRRRWRKLQDRPAATEVYWADPTANVVRLRAELTADDRFVALCLSEPPTTDRGRKELEAGLAAGCPAIIWDRARPMGPDARSAVASMATGGGIAALPARMAALRRQTLLLDPGQREGHVGHNLVLLWDDPDRIPDLAKPAADEPSPPIPDTAAPATGARSIAAVFVPGFLSSRESWSPLISLLQQDRELSGLELHMFEYVTPSMELRAHQIRRIDDLADSLWTYLCAGLAGADRLVLITHGVSGLLVQRMLLRLLREGRGPDLARIRQIVMFACPSSERDLIRLGAGISRAREGELRTISAALRETRRLVLDQVVHATEVTADQCPIRITSYFGEDDPLVTPAAARSVFPETEVLPGDHFTIIQPDSPTHPSYTALKARLLDALDHEAESSDDRPVDPTPPTSIMRRRKLVDLLLAIPGMHDAAFQQRLFGHLPGDVQHQLPHHGLTRLQVISLVDTLDSHRDLDAWQALTDALSLLVPDHPSVTELRHFLSSLDP